MPMQPRPRAETVSCPIVRVFMPFSSTVELAWGPAILHAEPVGTAYAADISSPRDAPAKQGALTPRPLWGPCLDWADPHPGNRYLTTPNIRTYQPARTVPPCGMSHLPRSRPSHRTPDYRSDR